MKTIQLTQGEITKNYRGTNGMRQRDGRTWYRLSSAKIAQVRSYLSLRAFIYNSIDRMGLSTYVVPNMEKNSDGSVNAYFGPTAPKGLESKLEPARALYFATVFGQQILEARIVSQWVPNRVYLQTLHGHRAWPA
jgi:hypothetical protein